MSYGIGPHDYDCACARCEARRSRTRSIHGDAHLTALIDERRDPKARPRIMMDVMRVNEVPPGRNVFEFRWYPRHRRGRTFEEDMARCTGWL